MSGKSPNNSINSDGKKRRSFVALLFAAGYAERSADIKEPVTRRAGGDAY